MNLVGFCGAGLRCGETCSVTLERAPGPFILVVGEAEAHREQMKPRVAESRLTVGLPDGSEIGGVEHLLAALAGLGIQHGVRISVDGPEVPLLDASANELALALRALAPPRAAPRLRVMRAGEVVQGCSAYSFDPGMSIDIAVNVEERRGERQHASWDGNPGAFLRRLAPARLAGYLSPGRPSTPKRARSADPAVAGLPTADSQARLSEASATPDESARHRLLDLLADLYLFGGPPLGRLRAVQPEHGATLDAILRALEMGVLGYRH